MLSEEQLQVLLKLWSGCSTTSLLLWHRTTLNPKHHLVEKTTLVLIMFTNANYIAISGHMAPLHIKAYKYRDAMSDTIPGCSSLQIWVFIASESPKPTIATICSQIVQWYRVGSENDCRIPIFVYIYIIYWYKNLKSTSSHSFCFNRESPKNSDRLNYATTNPTWYQKAPKKSDHFN